MMKLRRFTLQATSVALIWLTMAAAFSDSWNLQKGTDIPLVFDQAVSSKTAKAGDTVAMHVGDNIIVNGRTVIRQGEKVTAVVNSVEKRKHFGVNAKLKLTFDPVHSVWGQSIPIEPREKGKYTG